MSMVKARKLNWRPRFAAKGIHATLGPLAYNIIPANFGHKTRLEIFEENKHVRTTPGVENEQQAMAMAQLHADSYVSRLVDASSIGLSPLDQALGEFKSGHVHVTGVATTTLQGVAGLIESRAKAIAAARANP